LKVADLGETDLYIRRSQCRRTFFHLGFDVRLERPADELLAGYVARHVCQGCSRPGRKVICEGWLEDPHRSGAEGDHQRAGRAGIPRGAADAAGPIELPDRRL
jgi:hypothetical protein